MAVRGPMGTITNTGTIYNYFRDYDPAIGRYVQSDPIGLRGGLNTHGYVGGNPVTSIDPAGLVKWTGTFTGGSLIEVVGGGLYRYNLQSECVNGKMGVAKGWAFGGAAGIGVTIAGGISASTFYDFNSTPDPHVFDGTFAYAGAGMSIAAAQGKMYGSLNYTALLLLGGAYAKPGMSSGFAGFDFRASFISGSSIVTEGVVIDCACGR